MRATWISPDNCIMNQIVYFIVYVIVKTKSAYHSADIGSDYFLVLTYNEVRISKKLDVDKLQNSTTANNSRYNIGGAFEPLIGLETNNIEEVYSKFKNKYSDITGSWLLPR